VNQGEEEDDKEEEEEDMGEPTSAVSRKPIFLPFFPLLSLCFLLFLFLVG